jgi:hypothetical protein
MMLVVLCHQAVRARLAVDPLRRHHPCKPFFGDIGQMRHCDAPSGFFILDFAIAESACKNRKSRATVRRR